MPLILFSPWHAGSMLWWSNSLNAVLALLPVIVAFGIPLTEEFAEQTAQYSRRQILKNLLRFPIFWLGLLFLGYILIQALNYSWEFVWTENKRSFYMQKLADDQYIHWLPSGMKSPFKWTNPWQALLMWATPWLAVCAMWSTFRRRKAWCAVLWAMAATGALMAVLGIAAKLTAPDMIFWIWERPRNDSFGPYTYRNQASVYLYMATACAVALFFYYQRTSRSDSGIQWFALLLGAIAVGGSVMSFSRAGWIGTVIILLVAFALFIFRALRQRHEVGLRSFLWKGLLGIGIICGIGVSLLQVDFSLMERKWVSLGKELQGENVRFKSLTVRQAVALKTLEMFQDNKWTGWGAGSFRYYFIVYQQDSEELLHPLNWGGKTLNYKKRYFWKDAHSDWAQFLAEYGIIGCFFLLLGLGYWWGSLLLQLRSMHCEHWMLLAATVTMVGQAVLDIVFYNPSLLILFSLVLCSTRGILMRRQPR